LYDWGSPGHLANGENADVLNAIPEKEGLKLDQKGTGGTPFSRKRRVRRGKNGLGRTIP